MGEAALKRVTIDEFLAWDGEGDRRYELIAGEIVAMAPASSFHGAIVVNTGAALRPKLRPGCTVISEAGVILPWRNDTWYQVDVAVTCAPIRPRTWATPEPIVIIEVLSPSTASQDRAVKLVDYRRIESVQDIIFIASEQKRVEHWRRGERAWTVRDLEADDLLQLTSLGFEVPVEALYQGLDFDQDAAAQA